MKTKWTLFLLALCFSVSLFAAEKVFILNVVGPIGPASQDYIERGIQAAEDEKAKAVIIQLNTPGGLDTAMRYINETILTATLPVITYVAPSGARAASAGTFILYASHLAAMAPGTNLGAASPVNVLQVEQQKVVNDAAAYIRSLAELRGRNADWAESAVRQAASITAENAKQLKVIDEVAESIPDLLQKIDGHPVVVLGIAEKIETKSLEPVFYPTTWRYELLSFLTNPNIAYVLMLIGIYGLFFEFTTPGLVLPGVVGVIALLLALYAFQLMSINYVGLTLILLGLAFMSFEVYVSSFGVIGLGGMVAFIMGSVMLFGNHAFYHLDWLIILSMSLLSLAFFFMLVSLAVRASKKNIITGQEGLINQIGMVIGIDENNKNRYTVRVVGEMWQAESSSTLILNQKVIITQVKWLILTVEPINLIGET